MAVGTLGALSGRSWARFRARPAARSTSGPFQVHAYGLMLLLGIVAATWLTGRRWTGRWAFWSDPRGDLVFRVAMWGVLAGIVGARLYHVITSWSTVNDEWWEPFAVWEGGLGVWGGIGAGVLVGAWVVHRAGRERLRVHGRGRSGPPARAGDRALGQLLQPGALRQADRPAVGASRSRSRTGPAAYSALRDLPPDLPLRVALVPARRRRAAARGQVAQPEAARPVRRLRRSGTASGASAWSSCASTRRTSSWGSA